MGLHRRNDSARKAVTNLVEVADLEQPFNPSTQLSDVSSSVIDIHCTWRAEPDP